MKIVCILIAICLTAGPAVADTFVIPLPELTGDYEADPITEPNLGLPQMRTVDFTIPAEVTSIDQIHLVISGDWTAGEVTCDDGSGPESAPFLPELALTITSPGFEGDFFSAFVLPPDGGFTALADEFWSCCPGGSIPPDALLGADLHAELVASWALIGICWLSEDTFGTVSDVWLEIDGTVRTEASSWSAVKALYR